MTTVTEDTWCETLFVFIGSPLTLFLGLWAVITYIDVESDLGLLLGIGFAIWFFVSMGVYAMIGASIDDWRYRDGRSRWKYVKDD